MMSKIHQELMEEMRKEVDRMRLELRQELLSQQLCVEPTIETLLSSASKSIKGSCATPTT